MFRSVLTAAALTLTTACSPAVSLPASATTGDSDLNSVVVAPDGPSTGYTRAAFGIGNVPGNRDGWPVGPDGCSVRDETVARDTIGQAQHGRCYVVTATLADPYTGATVTGPTRTMDVDHVLPLAEAWRTNAASWTPAQRQVFATDPLELQLTTHAANLAKGDRGPEAWAPAPADQCHFTRTFTAIAVKYHLTVTAARKAALARMESGC